MFESYIESLKKIFCFHDFRYDRKEKMVDLFTGQPCFVFYKVCTKCKRVETFACNGDF